MLCYTVLLIIYSQRTYKSCKTSFLIINAVVNVFNTWTNNKLYNKLVHFFKAYHNQFSNKWDVTRHFSLTAVPRQVPLYTGNLHGLKEIWSCGTGGFNMGEITRCQPPVLEGMTDNTTHYLPSAVGILSYMHSPYRGSISGWRASVSTTAYTE